MLHSTRRRLAMAGVLAFGTIAPGPPVALAQGRVDELERYRIDHTRSVLDEHHLRLASGTISVGPSLLDVGSVRRLYSPPFVASDFELEVALNGRAVPLDGYVWYPNELQREGRLGDVAVTTTLLPLRQARAFVESIRLENRGAESAFLEVSLRASGTLDRAPSEQWQYSAPRSRSPLESRPFSAGGKEDDLSDVGFQMENEQGRIIATLIAAHPERRGGVAVERITLQPGVPRQVLVLAVLGDEDDYWRLRGNLEETLESNDRAWRELHAALRASAPELVTDNRALARFYDRGFLPLLQNRWHLPDFAAQPHYALDGLDGGGFCTYVWDMAYVAEYLTLTQTEFARDQIERFLSIDLTRSYAMSPLSGEGVGRWYAYNNYSLMRLLYQYVLVSGDTGFLDKEVSGRAVIDWALWLARWPAEESDPIGLLDYGETDNLLEVRKTEYEHYVPSPNAERVASMRIAAELCRMAGRPEGRLREDAETLRRVVLDELWSPEQKWMTMKDLAGERRTVYTIQVFDLLSLGILPPDVADGIVSHLNPDEFLSDFGLHSLAKTDPGYDERDVDWGGPGAYAGDAPELVQTLYRAGYPAEAEDLLNRILWWGERFPYYPQAMRADRMDYRHDGLANMISGLAAAQAVVFGLFGVELQPEDGGRLEIDPHPLADAGRLELTNLRYRGRTVAIRVRAGKGVYEVTVDGTTVERPLGSAFHVSAGS